MSLVLRWCGRGAAPGEFAPFWSPAQPYEQQIQRDPARLRSLTKDMPHLDPTFSMHLAMSDTWAGAKDKAFGQVAFSWLAYNFDDVARDLEQTGYAKNSQTKLMHRLQKVSPHSPQAVALPAKLLL